MAEYQRGTRPPVIDEALDRELMQYKGRWVAIDQGHVVASGDSAAEASAGARARSVMDPLLFRVPLHPERRAFR
jgi:hypothetical protein